jgi:transcriptional regulator with XRE-family HTH domain
MGNTNIDYQNEIRIALIQSRNDANKTQAQVAELLGVAESTIQNWEEGRNQPRAHMLLKWFRVLHLPTSPYLDDEANIRYAQYMALPEEVRQFIDTAIVIYGRSYNENYKA